MVFFLLFCFPMKKNGNHVIIHFGACMHASRQTQQPFSLQRPFPPRASLAWALPGQNVEFSSSSFLCNPRSKVPRKREWILRSNKHTFSDGKKLNSFYFIFLLQVSSVSSLKDRPWHDRERLSYCGTCRKIGSCISDSLISPFNHCFHAPQCSNW